MLFDIPHRIRKRIAVLDQQPLILFLAAPDFHQNKTSLQFFPVQREFQIPFRQLRLSAERSFGFVRAAVPDDHIPGAVLPGGNLSLELAIFKWMILHVDRQPLHARIQRRPLRHRPGLQHAVHFQPQVVMQTRCRMFLNHEHARTCGPFPARGLGSHLEIAFFPVLR